MRALRLVVPRHARIQNPSVIVQTGPRDHFLENSLDCRIEKKRR